MRSAQYRDLHVVKCPGEKCVPGCRARRSSSPAVIHRRFTNEPLKSFHRRTVRNSLLPSAITFDGNDSRFFPLSSRTVQETYGANASRKRQRRLRERKNGRDRESEMHTECSRRSGCVQTRHRGAGTPRQGEAKRREGGTGIRDSSSNSTSGRERKEPGGLPRTLFRLLDDSPLSLFRDAIRR